LHGAKVEKLKWKTAKKQKLEKGKYKGRLIF
jgi:hypothetical protein